MAKDFFGFAEQTALEKKGKKKNTEKGVVSHVVERKKRWYNAMR